MTEKRRCPNCGTELKGNEEICFYCGEEVLPASEPRNNTKNTYAPVFYEPEKDTDFVMPVDHDKAGSTPFEQRKPFSDDDYAEPYDDSRHKKQSFFKRKFGSLFLR